MTLVDPPRRTESHRVAARGAWPPPEPTMTASAAPLRRRSIWWARAAAAVGIGAAMLLDAGNVFVVPLIFVLVVPFEKLFPRHPGQRLRRPLAGLDIRYALTAPLHAVAGVAVGLVIGVASLVWVPGLLLRPFVALLPSGVVPIVGVLLFDLAVYWAHRWSHEVPTLWRFHAIHHSTEDLDWISGFRSHPLDGALVAPPFVFLLAAGFDAEFAGALAIVQIALGLFLHANVRWRLRPLHRLVITPEFHHWHHVDEPEAHHSNYSVFLPLWDIVFGTYHMPADRRPLTYGVAEPVPATMAGQLLWPFRAVRSPLDAARHPVSALRSGSALVRRMVGGIVRSTTRPRNSSAHRTG